MSPYSQNKQKKSSGIDRSWFIDGLFLASMGLMALALVGLIYYLIGQSFQSGPEGRVTPEKPIAPKVQVNEHSSPAQKQSPQPRTLPEVQPRHQVTDTTRGKKGNPAPSEMLSEEYPYIAYDSVDPDDLIAAFPLDGHAFDAGNSRIRGTIHGAMPAEDRFGNEKSALVFDGRDDYVQIGRPLATGDFTISFWIKSNGPQNKLSVPVSQGNMSYRGFGFTFSKGLYNGFTWGTDDPSRNYHSTWGYSTWHTLSFNFPRDIDKDRSWHHLAATCHDTHVAVFRDGVLQGSSDNLPILHGGDNFTIGRASANKDNNHRTFNGVIDDVRVYNRALSAADIESVFKENGWQAN